MNVWISRSPRSNSDSFVTLTCDNVKWSALSLFHHILHITKTAKRWSTGRERGKELHTQEKEREQNANWSFSGEISHSHPRRMDECLWWPLHVLGGTMSENKRNWFGNSGMESMWEGHLSTVVFVEWWECCPKFKHYCPRKLIILWDGVKNLILT